MRNFFTIAALSAAAAVAAEAYAGVGVGPVMMPAKVPTQIVTEVMYDMPEGELTWLDRDCDGFRVDVFNAVHGPVYGSIVQKVEGEDGYVYLSHMVSEYPVNTWIKFEREDNTLVMNGMHALYEEWFDELDAVCTLYLVPMKVEIDENNNGTFVATDDCRYVFNEGADGTLTAADPETLLGLCLRTGEEGGAGDWLWLGYGDRSINMTVKNEETLTVPEGLKTEDWVWTFDIENAFVRVGIDGDDIYVSGMNRSIPDAWIKGKINDGKVVFPSGQYMGPDMDIFYYTYFCGANFHVEENEDGEYIMTASLADSAVFDYDAEEKSMMMVRGYVINSIPDRIYPLYFYDSVDIAKQDRNPNTPPAMAYDIEVVESDWGNNIHFQLPYTDEDGMLLHTDKLYYEVYIDGTPLEFIAFDDDWNEVVMTRIPYNYEDYDIYMYGEDHTVYFYEEVERNIGIRSIYINENGEEIYSKMALWGETGVGSVDGGKKTVSETLYDLQGREVSASVKGVVVKVTEFSDGTVVRTKEIRK